MPEIQTQTPLEYEPVCDFCYTRCESGGNSCEPITYQEEALKEEPRCCDDCNINIVMDIRIKMVQRTLEQCYYCETITNNWKPLIYTTGNNIEYFCQDCFDECA